MAKRNKRYEPAHSKRPGPLDLPAAKKNIAAINALYKNPQERLHALANLLVSAYKNKTGDKVLSLIETARVQEARRVASQLNHFRNKFQFLDNPIGTRLKAIDNGFWAAVKKNNHSAATKSIMWAINFSKRANCEKYCSEYLEHLARRLLNEFVKTETKEKTRKLILDNLFCVSLKEAIKLAKSSGTKADLNSLGYLLLRGNSLFKSNGL